MKNKDIPVEDISDIGHLEARCQLYQCFATAFSDPGDDFLESILNGEFADVLIRLGDEIAYPGLFGQSLDKLIPGREQKQDIKVFYASCFEAGSQGISLRESAYSSLPEKALMEEILRYYQHFGLDLSTGGLRELPDTLAVELEFLHYLTFLEIQSLQADSASKSGENNLAALRLAQRDFLTEHPGTWVRPFMQQLERVPDSEFYTDLARLLFLFIQNEKRILKRLKSETIATG
jgi:DMSO reductase family type II enzyme chaperone